jgi:hypothetical protein
MLRKVGSEKEKVNNQVLQPRLRSKIRLLAEWNLAELLQRSAGHVWIYVGLGIDE